MHRYNQHIVFLIMLSFLGRNTALESQSVNTPSQILTIIEQSSIIYTIKHLRLEEPEANFPVLSTRNYLEHLGVEGIPQQAGAEKGLGYLASGNCEKAVKFLVQKSSDYQLLNIKNQIDLCDCLDRMKEWELSIPILLRLQSQHPNHFAIARKLARSYASLNQNDLALRQILMAWILNRNHPLIMQEVEAIAGKAGKDLATWQWKDQSTVEMGDDGPIIKFKAPNSWLAYGICNAVWKYEPGYSTKKEIEAAIDATELQLEECLMNALYTYRASEGEAVKEWDALQNSIDQNMKNEYLLFEMKLRANPKLAWQLNPQQINQLIDYISNCRL